MQGILFRYGPAAPQVAFRSGAAVPDTARATHRHLIVVSGMTEGLLFAPYVEHLVVAAERAGYALVQAQLTSSYQGWGVGSLDQDADDLLQLSRHLRSEMRSQGVVIMGHSTGCQDAVHFCKRHGDAEGAAPLDGVILQAPASDREWLSHFYPDVVALLPEAKAMVAAGRGDQVVARAPEALGRAPMSAGRLVSLVDRLGQDDMWSMDLSSDELSRLLGHMRRWPLLVVQSGADECVPDKSAIPQVGRRVMAAAGGAEGGARRHVVIAGAPHNAAGFEEELAERVEAFLAAVRR